jgi:cobalt-zinc-cadmium efflux system outer membrane protein
MRKARTGGWLKTAPPLIWAFALVASVAAGPAMDTNNGPLPLEQAIRRALQNNPAIQASRANWLSARQRIVEAGAWEDPKLSFNSKVARFVDIPRNGFVDQTLSVEQMLPLSGKNRSRERVAAAEALGKCEGLRRQELDVTAKVKGSYFRLANLYVLLELNRQDEGSLEQALEASKAKFEVGKQSQADYLMADVERQRIVEARRDLEQKLSEEQTRLKVLMNQDPFSSLGRPQGDSGVMPPPPVERLRPLTLAHRPEVRQAQAMVAQAVAKAQLARREWIPDPAVSVGAQHYNGGSQAVSELDAGVSINLPWFNGKKYRAEEREAQSDAVAAQKGLEQAQTEALGLLRDQLVNLETLHHHLQLYQDRLLPSARQTVASKAADYEADKAGLADVLSSQRAVRELQTMYYQDLTDYQVGWADLEALAGAELKSAGRESPNAHEGHHP